jgi:hypothetical protein
MAEEREADVFVRLGGADLLAGRLISHRRGKTESQTFVAEVSRAAGHWRTVAIAAGAAAGELELMEPAFEHEASEEAGELLAG